MPSLGVGDSSPRRKVAFAAIVYFGEPICFLRKIAFESAAEKANFFLAWAKCHRSHFTEFHTTFRRLFRIRLIRRKQTRLCARIGAHLSSSGG